MRTFTNGVDRPVGSLRAKMSMHVEHNEGPFHPMEECLESSEMRD